jgi:hypothetical protein
VQLVANWRDSSGARWRRSRCLFGPYLRAQHEDVLVAVVVHLEEGELDPLELVLVLRPDVPGHHQVPQDGGRELGERAADEGQVSRAAFIESMSRNSAKRRDEDRSPCGKAKSCCRHGETDELARSGAAHPVARGQDLAVVVGVRAEALLVKVEVQPTLPAPHKE